jgi:hypothetical protein
MVQFYFIHELDLGQWVDVSVCSGGKCERGHNVQINWKYCAFCSVAIDSLITFKIRHNEEKITHECVEDICYVLTKKFCKKPWSIITLGQLMDNDDMDHDVGSMRLFVCTSLTPTSDFRNKQQQDGVNLVFMDESCVNQFHEFVTNVKNWAITNSIPLKGCSQMVMAYV